MLCVSVTLTERERERGERGERGERVLVNKYECVWKRVFVKKREIDSICAYLQWVSQI